jgi:hypothetical protein
LVSMPSGYAGVSSTCQAHTNQLRSHWSAAALHSKWFHIQYMPQFKTKTDGPNNAMQRQRNASVYVYRLQTRRHWYALLLS